MKTNETGPASGGGKNEPWITSYHPDPEIDREVVAEALEGEAYDMSVGDAPWWWQCPACKRSHNRGHHEVIGVHRCLGCGYTGPCGMMSERREDLDDAPPPAEVGETPGPKVVGAPERIWLCCGEIESDWEFESSEDLTWTEHGPVDDTDPGYIRISAFLDLKRENAALSAEVERLRAESAKRLLALKAAALWNEMMHESEHCAHPSDARYTPIIGEWDGQESAGKRFGALSVAVSELRTAAINGEALRAEAGKEP